jgi:hypothetical protein
MVLDSEPERLAEQPTARLLTLHAAILAELRQRTVVRSANAPVSDYAELLVAKLTRGELAGPSQKSWDVLAPNGDRLQVKARLVDSPAKPSQLELSPFRSFDFDAAVIVLLSSATYEVVRASRVPVGAVQAHCRFRAHINGHVCFAKQDLLTSAGSEDLTDRLRRVAKAL